jgi:hypothetical protein
VAELVDAKKVTVIRGMGVCKTAYRKTNPYRFESCPDYNELEVLSRLVNVSFKLDRVLEWTSLNASLMGTKDMHDSSQ